MVRLRRDETRRHVAAGRRLMYAMNVDVAAGVIEVIVGGMWEIEHVNRFTTDIPGAVQSIVCTGKTHLLLVDYSRSGVMSQAVVTALQHFSLTATVRAERCALFTASNLARLQAKRIATTHPSIAVFADRDSALAWLLEARALSQPTVRLSA